MVHFGLSSSTDVSCVDIISVKSNYSSPFTVNLTTSESCNKWTGAPSTRSSVDKKNMRAGHWLASMSCV